MSRVDLLVVGGGPAGAAFAALAAGAGARVVLLERERFPRDKLCGEFLSAEGCRVLERLGVLEPLLSAGTPRMDSCRITDLRGRSIEASLPDLPGTGREAIGVSRALLDATLLHLARRRGALVRERCEATAPVLDNGRVRGAHVREVGSAGPAERIEASVVIAADGRRSFLVRALHAHLGDPSRSRARAWFGLKAHLDGDPARLGRRVELHLFNGGYAGLGTVEGGLINLCLLVTVGSLRSCGGSPDRLLRERIRANPHARDALEGAGLCGGWKSVGPLRFGVRRPSAAGALFLGDAAGTIDPFSGEGMANALRSAEIALPFALEAAARGELTNDLASGYKDAWKLAFAGVTRRARRLGWLLEHPALAGAALAFLSRAGRPLLPRLVASTRTGVTAGRRLAGH